MNALVIGDYFIDRYSYCSKRHNPESIAPCYNITKQYDLPGGAGNVLNCLERLGDKASILKSNDADIVKQRFLDENGIQLMRADYGTKYNAIDTNLLSEGLDHNYIIISDYAKGSVSEKLVKKAKNITNNLFVDTKPQNIDWYKEVFLIKPNAKEAREMTSEQDLVKAGQKLIELTNSNILITNGDNGMLFFDKKLKSHQQINPINVNFKDVTGAGDVVISTIAYYYSKNNNLIKSIKLANIAASISVQHIGCYQPTKKEIENNGGKEL